MHLSGVKMMLRGILVFAALSAMSAICQADIYLCTVGDKKAYQDEPCEKSNMQGGRIELPGITNVEAPRPSEHDNNIVKNSSFDEGLDYWSIPENAWWDKSRGVGNSGVAVIQSEIREKTRYIYEEVIEQCIPIHNFGPYGLSADVRLPSGAEGKYPVEASIYWYKTEDCSAYGAMSAWVRPDPSSTSWQHVSKANIKPFLGASAVKIRLKQNGYHSKGGQVFWDNVQVFPMQAGHLYKSVRIDDLPDLSLGESVIQNGSFNGSASFWRISDSSWSSDAGKGALWASLKSEQGGRGTGVARQCVKLGKQRDYELGGKFLKDINSSAPGSGRLRVSWNDSDDCRGRSGPTWKQITVDDRNGWQEKSVELVAPSEARAANVEIILAVKETGVFSGFWDDIYLMRR
jgi:hypothetical protein